LKKGTVVIENGCDNIVLSPETDISIALNGSSKDNKEKLSIKLSWVKLIPEEDPEPLKLKISSKVPAPPKVDNKMDVKPEEKQKK
jgi:hypothetical protein